MDEDEEKIAVAASFGISAVFKSPSGKSSQQPAAAGGDKNMLNPSSSSQQLSN